MEEQFTTADILPTTCLLWAEAQQNPIPDTEHPRHDGRVPGVVMAGAPVMQLHDRVV